MTNVSQRESDADLQARIDAIMERTRQIRASKEMRPGKLDYQAVVRDYNRRARRQPCLTQ